MTVGIYDEDFFKYGGIPSLEAMKLLSYYRKNNHIAKLCPTFNPQYYSKFVYRKDYNDGEFQPNLSTYNNVEYGGMAFTNGIYVPMDLAMEQSVPYITPYEKHEDIFCNNEIYDKTDERKKFKTIMRAPHVRISLDGKTVMPGVFRQLDAPTARVIFTHDTHLTDVDGGLECVREMLDRYSSVTSLNVKYPLLIKDADTYEAWHTIRLGQYSQFEIVENLNDEEFARIVEASPSYKNTQFSRLLIDVSTVWSSEDEFLEEGILKIYKWLIFSCMHNKRILLTYRHNFFSDIEWEKTIKLMNDYSLNERRAKWHKTFADFAKNLTEEPVTPIGLVIDWTNNAIAQAATRSTKKQAREVFFWCADKNPELFKMFYECKKVYLQGGEFHVV